MIAETIQSDGLPLRSRRATVWRRLVHSPPARLSLVVLALITFACLAAPLLGLAPPAALHMDVRLTGPGAQHWFGTDELGRDLFSRILHGGRLSLGVGVMVVLLAGVVGTAIGLFTGYFRGPLDEVLMRVMDIMMAFPPLILAMAVSAALGPSLQNAMLATAIVMAPRYTRIVRGEILVLREADFIQAARATGASDLRLLLRYLLPNCLAPILVLSTLSVGTAILTAASLSFIGLGAQQPTPEWGAMVSDGRNYLLDAPWYATSAGVFIFAVVLAFNLLGDGLRDALDPKLQGR